MVIYGVTVTDEQINAAIARMKEGEFTCHDLEAVLLTAGVPEKVKVPTKFQPQSCAYRVADRILQRERKAGNISFDNKVWRWKA